LFEQQIVPIDDDLSFMNPGSPLEVPRNPTKTTSAQRGISVGRRMSQAVVSVVNDAKSAVEEQAKVSCESVTTAASRVHISAMRCGAK
jgi:hypothetical protein